MINLGLLNYFIGIEIKQSENDVFICQEKYAKKKKLVEEVQRSKHTNELKREVK